MIFSVSGTGMSSDKIIFMLQLMKRGFQTFKDLHSESGHFDDGLSPTPTIVPLNLYQHVIIMNTGQLIQEEKII